MRWVTLMGSDRPGHLFANAIAAIITAPFAPKVAVAVLAWEWFASPDMDLTENRRPKGVLEKLWVWFWLPYGKLVAHRSRFSHSLLLGTTCRLAYVVAWGAISAYLLGYDIDWQPLLDALWLVWLALQNLGRVIFDSIQNWLFILYSGWISDGTHLLKDNYRSPVKILIGN